MEFGDSYPRNLSYSIKYLTNFSKQTIRLNVEKTELIKANDIIKIRFPRNTIVDNRTFTLYFEGSTKTTTPGDQVIASIHYPSQACHFPRNTSSIIDNLSTYVNNRLLDSISNYNHVYNAIYDMAGGDIAQESKRGVLENIDPTVSAVTDNATGRMVFKVNPKAKYGDTKNVKFAINNWLGFLGSSSTPCFSTASTGEIIVEIRTASNTILWNTGEADVPNVGSYELNKVKATITKIVFQDPDYYAYLSQRVLGEKGLRIAFNTYTTNKTALILKGSHVSATININASSIDCLYALPLCKRYNENRTLALYGRNAGGLSYPTVCAYPRETITDDGTAVTEGYLFNQSFHFCKDATGITGSAWEINNTSLNPYILSPEEVFGETLIALGNTNIDMTSGINKGCDSISAFEKYYWMHACSLENLCNDGQFFKSGYDTQGATVSINWKSNWIDGIAHEYDSFVPLLVAKCTKIMVIKEGNQIDIIH